MVAPLTFQPHPFFRMAPCAPKRPFYDAELVGVSEDAAAAAAMGALPVGDGALFHLLDSGAFAFDPTCLFDSIGADPNHDDLDDRLSPRYNGVCGCGYSALPSRGGEGC